MSRDLYLERLLLLHAEVCRCAPEHGQAALGVGGGVGGALRLHAGRVAYRLKQFPAVGQLPARVVCLEVLGLLGNILPFRQEAARHAPVFAAAARRAAARALFPQGLERAREGDRPLRPTTRGLPRCRIHGGCARIPSSRRRPVAVYAVEPVDVLLELLRAPLVVLASELLEEQHLEVVEDALVGLVNHLVHNQVLVVRQNGFEVLLDAERRAWRLVALDPRKLVCGWIQPASVDSILF